MHYNDYEHGGIPKIPPSMYAISLTLLTKASLPLPNQSRSAIFGDECCLSPKMAKRDWVGNANLHKGSDIKKVQGAKLRVWLCETGMPYNMGTIRTSRVNRGNFSTWDNSG